MVNPDRIVLWVRAEFVEYDPMSKKASIMRRDGSIIFYPTERQKKLIFAGKGAIYIRAKQVTYATGRYAQAALVGDAFEMVKLTIR